MVLPSIPRRAILVVGLLFTAAAPTMAASAVFHCTRADSADPLPCRVRLVPAEPTKPVIEATPDKPIELQPGRYEIRAGAPGFALAANVSYTASVAPPGSPSDRVPLSLVPGGSVSIESSAVPSPGAVQLVSFATGKTDVLFVDREREVPVPAGKLVAVGLISPGKFLGMTAVLSISRGEKTVVKSFARPGAGRANVFVRGDYAGGSPKDPKDVTIALSTGAAKIEPASSTNAAPGSHYSVFYEVPQGPKRIDVSSKRWRLSAADLAIAEPFVFKGDLALVPKPSLTVRPIGVSRSEKWNAKVYSCRETDFGPGTPASPPLDKCVSERVVEGSGSEGVVPDLDAKWYFVAVELGGKQSGKQVDLRSGQDRQEDFDFQRRRVYGFVRQGDQGVAATLTFKNTDTGDRADDATAGPDGAYEEILTQSGKYRVEIRTEGVTQAQAAVFPLTVGDEDSIQKDFTIPGGRVTVVVSNERTREPIRNASIGFLLAGANEERKTDESGLATLPPLPAGQLRLLVQADGYQKKDQNFQVAEAKTAQRFTVLLTPLDTGPTFRAILPDGSPAASATVLWILDANGGFSYRQRCDSAGTCRFAQRPSEAETLFIVHKQAGLTIVSAGTAFQDQEVRLLPVGGPLVMNVRRASQSPGAMSAKAIVAGVVLPTFALETIANLVGETSQLFLYPGAGQPLIIAGLPAGTPLAVVVSPAAIGPTQSPVQQIPVQLPLTAPLDVVVP